ncbi:AAA family ATPase [Halobacteriovorax sp. YZS-1-1]|uniref:AAA family ATPase n=1 Tax=unclassified Halobacteriovorax TaxID=2639665 RepID=UPI00399A3F3E
MLKRISRVSNFGVYQDFVWGESLKRSNRIIDFNKFNIIYGRNYSGKTTLSRVVRCLEKQCKHEDYKESSTVYTVNGGEEISCENLNNFNQNLRVFNKDFVKDNLSILFNDDAEISTFAVLGDKNVEVESKIKSTKEKLGNVDEKSGQIYDYFLKSQSFKEKKKIHNDLVTKKDDVLRNKAREMKSDSDFGDVSYSISKIKVDIGKTLEDDFVPADKAEQSKLREIINEDEKDTLAEMPPVVFSLEEAFKESLILLESEVTATVTINDLESNASAQSWVKSGIEHNKERDKCLFCDNSLSESSWKRLRDHFNRESELLEQKIDSTLAKLDMEVRKLEGVSTPSVEGVYSEYKAEFEQASKAINEKIAKMLSNLNIVIEHLSARKGNIFKKISIDEEFVVSNSFLFESVNKLNEVIEQSNNHHKELDKNKKIATSKLRLSEVYNFIQTISYEEELKKIGIAKKESDDANQEKMESKAKKEELDQLLVSLESELKDESKGAEKINKFLADYFGHESLRLEHFEEDDVGTFKIMRGGEVAKNLSEGESSLIAFCYFMAKLHDLETKKEETIIWIDDPISSLDSNHIFFVFSLIENEIAAPSDTGSGNKYNYDQLFISTHNLEFLKYLKRLSHPFVKDDNGKKIDQSEYFLIERNENRSIIKLMPKHLYHYVTEFNYLFEKIKACAEESAEGDNYDIFYNFGNNLRKFLESYLFYRYPNRDDLKTKVSRFFGTDGVAKTLIMRISNEMSHADGTVERSSMPIDVSEAQKVACYVLEKIKERDLEQYEALVRSIR